MRTSALESSDFSFNDVADILRRRKGIMLACLAAALLAGAVVTLRAPRLYVATSQLVFLRPSYTVLLSDKVLTPPQYEEKSTQVYLLKSRTVADEAASLMRAKDVEVSGAQVRGAIKIKDVTDTEIMEISAQTDDPKMSAMMANSVAEAFVSYKRRARRGTASAGIEDLRDQMEAARKELTRREKDLSAFLRGVGFTDVKKAGGAIQDQIIAFELQLAKDIVARDEARSRANELARQVGIQNRAIAETGILRDNEAIQALQAKLITQEMELASAEQKYTDKYPGTLDDLKRSVADIKGRLKKEIENIVAHDAGALEVQQNYASQLAQQEMEYLAAAARCEGLTRVLAERKTKLAGMPKLEMDILHIMREEAAAEQIYTTLLGSYEAAKADQTRQTDIVQVTELATTPTSPVSPKPMRNMTYALIVGIVLAVSAGLLLERIDDTIHSAEEARSTLGIPVLGQIPRFGGDRLLITDMHFKSPIPEAYRTLRANISFAAIDREIRTLLLTSAAPGEGKSLTATNLSITMAQGGRKVILVDADLRRPSIAGLLQIPPSSGLTDVLIGKTSLAEALQDIGLPNLLVLPTGPLPPNPAETIGSQRMRDLMSELRESAEVVVFDTPPCNLVSDSLMLAALADATIQVVEMQSVSRSVLLQAEQSLLDAKATIIGSVLNGVQPSSPYAYTYYGHPDDTDEPPRGNGRGGILTRIIGRRNARD